MFIATSSSFAPHCRFHPMHLHQLLTFAFLSIHFSTSSSSPQHPFRLNRCTRSLNVQRRMIQLFTALTLSHLAIPSLSFRPHPSFRTSLPLFRPFLTSHPAYVSRVQKLDFYDISFPYRPTTQSPSMAPCAHHMFSLCLPRTLQSPISMDLFRFLVLRLKCTLRCGAEFYLLC